MNRAAVDEEDQSEILKILELEKASFAMSSSGHPNYENFDFQREQKGTVSFDQYYDITNSILPILYL